jgi:hypothetical protein
MDVRYGAYPAYPVFVELAWCAVEDEENPKHLVEALRDDVFPHLFANEGFVTAVRLVQEQVRRRILSSKSWPEHDRLNICSFGGIGSSPIASTGESFISSPSKFLCCCK